MCPAGPTRVLVAQHLTPHDDAPASAVERLTWAFFCERVTGIEPVLITRIRTCTLIGADALSAAEPILQAYAAALGEAQTAYSGAQSAVEAGAAAQQAAATADAQCAAGLAGMRAAEQAQLQANEAAAAQIGALTQTLSGMHMAPATPTSVEGAAGAVSTGAVSVESASQPDWLGILAASGNWTPPPSSTDFATPAGATAGAQNIGYRTGAQQPQATGQEPDDAPWYERAWNATSNAAGDAAGAVTDFTGSVVDYYQDNPQEYGELLASAATTAAGLVLAAGGATMEGGGIALDFTGVGAIAGVPMNIAGAGMITAGGAIALAGGATLGQNLGTMLKERDTAYQGGGATGDPPSPQVAKKIEKYRNSTDNSKAHLTEKDLDAARRELDGEVFNFDKSKPPYQHVTEVQETQAKLLKTIDRINKDLGHPDLSAADRTALREQLSSASKLLDHSRKWVPAR